MGSGSFGSLEGRLSTGRESEEWMRTVRCPNGEVVQFTRHLAALLNAGISILPALESLAEQTSDPSMAEVIWTLRDRVTAGHALSHSFQQFPRTFPPLVGALLRVGEQSGALVSCLERTAAWLERGEQVRRRVISSLTYPVLVFVFSLALTALLFVFVLPPFLNCMVSLGVDLPLPTRIVFFLTRATGQPGLWLAALGLMGLAVLKLREVWQQQEVRAWAWRLSSAVPWLGRALLNQSLARLCWATELMLLAGCGILPAWRLAGEASGNPLIQEDLKPALQALQDGSTLADHMFLHPGIYPTALAHMVHLGEETARLPRMLAHLAGSYELDVEVCLDMFTAMAQPLLLAFVSSLMLFLMGSVFLPLYSFLSHL